MWNFLWHLRGSTSLDGAAEDEMVLDSLETLLVQQDKSVKERGSNYIIFNSPIFQISPGWLAMVIYNHGRIWITREGKTRLLNYDLKSLRALFYCVFGASFIAAFTLKNESLAESTKIAVFAFSWLYGANLCLAWIRIPHSILEAIRRA